jgi:glycine cleavage system H lipoate-binding protein
MSVLLFIATIIIFLTVDYFVQRSKNTALAAQPVLRKTIPMRAPAGIFFARSHTWLSLFPSGRLQLGIDDFLAQMFTAPRLTMLKAAAESVQKGEPIMRLAEGPNEVFVRSPIDGVIENVNSNLDANPGLLKEALFSEGWAYSITPARAGDLRGFYLGGDTRVWLKQELARLRDFFARLAPAAPAFMQDGGLPVAGVMNLLDPEQCRQFEKEFLAVE